MRRPPWWYVTAISVHVEAFDTIDNVKAKVQDKAGIPANHQILLFKGEQVEDGRPLSSYSIPEDAQLDVCLATFSRRRPMTKRALANAIAEKHQITQSVARSILNTVADICTTEVQSVGTFKMPRLVKIERRTKPATMVRPARRVVKAFPVPAVNKYVQNSFKSV